MLRAVSGVLCDSFSYIGSHYALPRNKFIAGLLTNMTLENIIGFFIRDFLLRRRISGNAAEFCKKVKKALLCTESLLRKSNSFRENELTSLFRSQRSILLKQA